MPRPKATVLKRDTCDAECTGIAKFEFINNYSQIFRDLQSNRYNTLKEKKVTPPTFRAKHLYLFFDLE